MENLSSIEKLFHAESAIRLSIFETLCRRQKTTEIISRDELRLIQHFIYFNTNVGNQGFHQKYTTSIKYLLIQLKGSGYAIFREKESQEREFEKNQLDEILTSYKEFLTWFIDFCFYCLRMRGNYSRRACTLHILDLIYCSSILKDDLRDGYINTWNLLDFWTVQNVKTLVFCLTDPYESNQSLALQIAKKLPQRCFASLDWSTILNTAFEWCCMSKTQYPEMAVYYFLFTIHKSDFAATLKSNETEIIDDSYTNDGLRLLTVNRLILLRRLLHLLSCRTDAAEKDLARASVEGPPWGLLRTCLYIFKEFDWGIMEDEYSIWGTIVRQMLSVCHRLAKVVEPIVNSASPEGYVPTTVNIDSDFGRTFNDVTVEQENIIGQAVQVCSWRTQKEVSALFSYLASIQRPRPILELDELERIGDYFLVQLTECKHRGAFECAYSAFVTMCESLWLSPNERMQQLPKCWLRKIVDGLVIMSTGDSNCGISYCITRRSAGVPFLIQAVLATEPRTNGASMSSLLHETLQKLLRILFRDGSVDQEDTAKVHALNILRALVKESKLGLSSLSPPWLSLIVQADLISFTYRSWAVRNSAALLFSSWMVRIFGVPRNRDDISSKNKLSCTDFERLCPDLLDFMLEQLRFYSYQKARCTLMSYGEMILFPILSILTRIFPSNSKTHKLRCFVPYALEILLNCPIVNVRRSAASSLHSILDSSSVYQLVVNIGKLMVDGHNRSQNLVHGVLLLIERFGTTTSVIRASGTFSKETMSRFCPLNLAVLFRVFANRRHDLLVDQVSTAFRIVASSPNEHQGTGQIAQSVTFGPTALLAIYLKTKENASVYDAIWDHSNTNPFFRIAFYKQWRSVIKRNETDSHLLVDAKRFFDDNLVWQDILGRHTNLKLRIQASKFVLLICRFTTIAERNQRRAQELFTRYIACREKIVRRLLLCLTCGLFVPTSDRQFENALLREMDASSKPEQPLDDRMMTINCLVQLDDQFVLAERTALLIIFIRLLTDMNDVVRDEAASVFMARFSYVGAPLSPGAMLFICVANLLFGKSNDDGKRALCNYLLEIAHDLSEMLDENSSNRVFDKNESNCHLEPVLITEWLRILSTSDYNAIKSIEDLTNCLRPCLATDGLKNNEDIVMDEDRDRCCCRILRQAVSQCRRAN